MYEGKIVAFRPPSVPVEELGMLMAGVGGDGEAGEEPAGSADGRTGEAAEDAAVGRPDPSDGRASGTSEAGPS
jgi:hypothetical protein